ncbi:MAG TPA: MBL fold metallo-hydrolase, partial [Spirochaetes bacterium]|nr:MBL fold metallo-hydrolase [Spirochaetota bacterium]
PQIIFLLMAQYLNANQKEAGIQFFTSFIKKYDKQLSPPQKSLYLSALAVLRAIHAPNIPLLSRIEWVEKTIDMLEKAKEYSKNQIYVVRWIRGIIFARLPERFKTAELAIKELNWCMDHISKAPDPGWIRETYYHLALVYHKQKKHQLAKRYLGLSGYPDFNKKITHTSSYSVNGRSGFIFGLRQLKEIVANKVFLLTGFEFTEHYFIVSDDRKHLIAIDAGTRPDTARAAHEYLLKRHPNLPPVTTVFFTHSHWDHIGGYSYYRKLNPEVKFYIRDNYRQEMRRVLNLNWKPENTSFNIKYFFGSKFRMDFIKKFKPDIKIAKRNKVTVGGTQFELVPIPGGETLDGLFIYMPKFSILFAGDFAMPYIGAPFVEEGSILGLFEAIDIAASLKPKILLHGHSTLSTLYHSITILKKLKRLLTWLYHETNKSVSLGMSRAAIHKKNLIPPFLLNDPDMHVIYLVARENFINRVYDKAVGYWESNLDGIDHLGQNDFGTLLTHYLGLNEGQIGDAVEKMIRSGDHELAARTLSWSLTQYPNSLKLKKLKHQTYLKLKEKYSSFNPFKFIIYSSIIKHETPQVTLPKSKQ